MTTLITNLYTPSLSRNAYPYCKTVITNPGYMKSNFFIKIETMHYPDRGQQENIHELPPEKLKHREVIHIDIANDQVSNKVCIVWCRV